MHHDPDPSDTDTDSEGGTPDLTTAQRLRMTLVLKLLSVSPCPIATAVADNAATLEAYVLRGSRNAGALLAAAPLPAPATSWPRLDGADVAAAADMLGAMTGSGR